MDELSQWARKGKKHAVLMQIRAIVTIKEAEEITGVSRFTIKDAIKQHRIWASQSGKTWLMRRQDVIDKWGLKEGEG